MLKFLMGNEAIGLAAILSGARAVCGYPGTPSTEVLESAAKFNDGSVHVQWSVNEKAALEVAAGVSYAGGRVMVTMKQVGLNVATDPLMSLAYVGTRGGMVILVADDPGPISSQTEQDTRRFASYAKIPVLDPSNVQEAFDMAQAAFKLSEEKNVPVILRPTTRICHACASVTVPDEKEVHTPDGFQKDPKYVIFPRLSYQNHLRLDAVERALSADFSASPFNRIEGSGTLGIVTSGVSYAYVKEALSAFPADIKLLKIGTPYPFPKSLAREFTKGLSQILVVEELDSVLEDNLYMLLGENGIPIHGRRDQTTNIAGENSVNAVKQAISRAFSLPECPQASPDAPPPLPVRPPVLCAGCPHRASFYAVKQAMAHQKAVFCGDIGCYTLGNAAPLHMVDTCLCMGADVTIAQGLNIVEPDVRQFSFIGDSTFFHTGIPGVINAKYNNADITLIVLDNQTTAMTGHQPHPGTGKTMMNTVSETPSIENILRALNVEKVDVVNPFDLDDAIKTVRESAAFHGVSAVIFRSPCIAVSSPRPRMVIHQGKCLHCLKCIREIGCPAIAKKDGMVQIDRALCYGCTLCMNVCPVQAIGGEVQ